MLFGFFPFSVGPMELAIVGCVAVLLFGKNLPSVARSLGQAIPAFKSGLREIENEVRSCEAELKKDLKP